MSKQVVVLAMGRTGSSMLAQILRTMGVYMGTVFDKPNHANPLGFWEDAIFKGINERLLRGLPTPGVVTWASAERWTEMRLIVDSRDEQHEFWGWKNTHTALTVGLWDRLLSNPRYIWLERDAESVVASHKRAWGIDEQMMRENYDIYTNAIASFLDGKEYLRLDYDTLIEQQDVGLIADFVGIDCDLELARTAIMPHMRHITKEPVSQ